MNDLRDDLSRAGRQAPELPPDAFDRLRRRRARRARRGRVTAATLSLAVAAVAIGGVLLAFRPHDASSGKGRIRSAAGTDLSVGANQFAYEKTISYTYGPSGDGRGWPLYVDRFTEQSWYRADGAGRDATVDANDFFTPADRQTFIQQMGHTPPDIAPSDKTYAAGDYPTDTGDISYLSTDPATLLTQLQDRSAPTGRSPEPSMSDSPGQPLPAQLAVWFAIQDLINRPNATPALKAALFEVAKQLPGIDVVQNSIDPVGRPGILLRLQVQGTHEEYWFDPSSEQLLAWRTTIETDAFPQYPKGTVDGIEIVTASGVTDSTDDAASLAKSFVPAPVTSPPAMPDPGN